jgi:antitoxin component YwqK of YwqJK toxin-antitoxin module
MRNIITICLLLPLLGVSQIDAKKLEQQDGIFYEVGKSKPFTGTALTYFENGKKQSSTEYKDGQINGKLEGWYPSGAKQVEGELINGQKAGMWIAWYENGQKIRQGAFKNGTEDGEYIWWFENGNLNKKGIYHNGLSDGKWLWYYESGQQKQEGFLRGKTEDGTWKEWYENGKQKMVGTFTDGKKNGDWTWWNENGKVTTKKVYRNGLLVEGTDDLDSYIEKMEYHLTQRDFKAALSNVEKAVETIQDKSEGNKIYMGLAVYHSKVYSYFQHIDQAEAILLKATGLPDEDIAVIVNAKDRSAHKALKELAKKIEKHPETETKVGPHITLALLYNILGDTVTLQKEQQLMMDRSGMSDWVLQISMELYRLRGVKENAYGYIGLIKDEMKKEGETRDNQLAIANYYLQVGLFDEARQIADKYLEKDKKDIGFLFVQTNIEMGLGNMDKMMAYETKILEIDPKAFEQ